MSKSLLIIGGTGFVGKAIINYFETRNPLQITKIIILSRNAKNKKIKKILKKKIKIIKISADIIKINKLPTADYIIYCAILKNYDRDLKGVKNYKKLAIKHHLQSKILYLSSGAVYGVQKNKNNFKESFLNKFKKNNFKNGYKKKYSLIKLKNEKLFKELGKKGLNVSIARCFSFVGPDLPLNSHYVIGNIIDNILKKKMINIKANYKIMRSYMYSDDLVRWLIKILQNSTNKCPIYNVGSDDKVSIHQVSENLAKKFNLKTSNKVINLNKIDYYIPNINKAKKKLKLNVKYNSSQSINKTINFYLNNFQNFTNKNF